MGKGLGLFVGRLCVQRDVDLHPFRAGGLGKTLHPEVVEDRTHPEADLRTLHDIGGWPGIEVEDHHGGRFDVRCERKRRMQLQRGQVGNPNQRWKIVRKNVIDGAAVALAPDRCRLYAIGTMHGRVLLEEVWMVHAFWITLHGEWTSV